MGEDIEIREGLPSDNLLIERLYPAAFPDEDLLPLVRELLEDRENVLSLLATADEAVVGHVAFTRCGIDRWPERVALLGPLAVRPESQGRGIGTALVREGLERLKAAGTVQVQVLGDPAYYGRFGFTPDAGVAPPYPLSEEWREAWQSLGLGEGPPALRGKLSVPGPWRNPVLWLP